MNISGDGLLYTVTVSSPFFFVALTYYFFKSHSVYIGTTWRIIITNVLIFSILLSTLFLAFESYYRFIYDESDSFSMTRVSNRWFDRYYQYNNFYIRDNIKYVNKKGVKPRFTFLGDSFTVGHGIKNVGNRFGNIIRKLKSNEWEVHVFAGNGLDTAEELEGLKDAVNLGYEIDNVILIYCLNDISDLVQDWRKLQYEMGKETKKQGYLLKHSFFINTLYYRIKAALNPNFSNYYNFISGAYTSLLWDVQKNRLQSINNYVQERGGSFFVVMFPFLHSFKTKDTYYSVHNQLAEFFSEQKISHLDLLPVFKKYSSYDLTVNKFDAHPNEFSHSLAAQSILEFLEYNHSNPASQ